MHCIRGVPTDRKCFAGNRKHQWENAIFWFLEPSWGKIRGKQASHLAANSGVAAEPESNGLALEFWLDRDAVWD